MALDEAGLRGYVLQTSELFRIEADGIAPLYMAKTHTFKVTGSRSGSAQDHQIDAVIVERCLHDSAKLPETSVGPIA